MERLAGAPDLRARYAAAARNLAVEKFASDIIGRQTVELYRQLLDVAARSNPAAPST